MTSIWKTKVSIDEINRSNEHGACGHLGIEILELGPDFVKGRMPVDHRTQQPIGLLHGGASMLLAETLGSIGAFYSAGADDFICVGQEINGNHVRGVRQGWVYGVARPHHIGQRSHVWGIHITDDQDRLVCIARLTVAVLPR